MKYSIEESLLRINERSRQIKYRKERNNVRFLAVMTVLAVFAFVAAVYGYVDFEGVGAGQSAYGSFMLPDEAGGYVIVGVLCFAAAVVITLVCIKWKNKSDKIKDKENEGEP